MLHDSIDQIAKNSIFFMNHCHSRTVLSLLIALAVTLTSLPASAVRFYDVELVLFENIDTSQVNNEVWPEQSDAGEPSAIDLFGIRGDLPRTDTGFEVLGVAEKELSGTVARLRRSSNYRPILHLAWRQPGLGASKAVPVRIAGGRRYINPQAELPLDEPGAASTVSATDTTSRAVGAAEIGSLGSLPVESIPAEVDEIDGTIKIVLGRYLHVHTDLLFRRLMPSQFGIQPDPNKDIEESDATDTENSVASPPANEPTPTLQPVSNRLTGFRMQQKRRMRSSELHYIDHPAFGMMVVIRRAPEQDG